MTAAPEATVSGDSNWHPATEPPTVNPVTRLREAGHSAREDHYRRMGRVSDLVVAVIRPRWVVILGVTAATQRKADRWTAACNTAFAFVLLLVTSLTARGVLGKDPLMVLAALAATAGVMKLIRIQLTRPYEGDGGDGT